MENMETLEAELESKLDDLMNQLLLADHELQKLTPEQLVQKIEESKK